MKPSKPTSLAPIPLHPYPKTTPPGIVDKAADLDVASVLSMGFPAYR